MEQHIGLIVSLISLIVSGIMAYSYLQIRLSLAEQILQVLNGRYLSRVVADERFKAMEKDSDRDGAITQNIAQNAVDEIKGFRRELESRVTQVSEAEAKAMAMLSDEVRRLRDQFELRLSKVEDRVHAIERDGCSRYRDHMNPPKKGDAA